MESISKQDLEKLNHHKQIYFACFCAKQVFHLVEEEHKEVCLKAIKTAYLFLEGKASKEECSAATSAAYAAAANASANAAYTAAYAANAAAYAAYAATSAAYAATSAAYAANAAAYAATSAAANAAAYADKPLIIEAQWAFYDQLLNGDKYFEQIVLEKA